MGLLGSPGSQSGPSEEVTFELWPGRVIESDL